MTVGGANSELRSQSQRLKYLLLASVSLALGAWLSVRVVQADLFLLRERSFGWWDLSHTLLRCAIAAFLIGWGAKTLRRSGEASATGSFGWGKSLLGLTFIYASIKALFVPQRSFFSAETKAQTAQFDSVTAIMCLLGIVFILAAFLKKRGQRAGQTQ